MNLIISCAVVILASAASALLPVKLAASKLEVGKPEWLYCVIAVVMSVIVINAVSYVVPVIFVAVPVAIGMVGIVYETILETTLKKGLCIAFIAVLIQFAVSSLVLNLVFK